MWAEVDSSPLGLCSLRGRGANETGAHSDLVAWVTETPVRHDLGCSVRRAKTLFKLQNELKETLADATWPHDRYTMIATPLGKHHMADVIPNYLFSGLSFFLRCRCIYFVYLFVIKTFWCRLHYFGDAVQCTAKLFTYRVRYYFNVVLTILYVLKLFMSYDLFWVGLTI